MKVLKLDGKLQPKNWKNQVVTLGFNNIAEYTLYPHFEFNELKVA